MPAENLCLQCGLCCNGVIFADGQLQPEDDAARLKSLGLKLKRGSKFHQPCGAFANGCCKIYQDRPAYCRQFDCALLERVKAGQIDAGAARRKIAQATKQAANVRSLLRQLGSADEHVALGVRFRRLNECIHRGELDDGTSARYGELTLAMHRLNVILSRDFYPA
jgi:uncharacterized protein